MTPSVTHHPKPPKETLRFLPNMVSAVQLQNPGSQRSPWGLLEKELRSSRVAATGWGAKQGTSLFACPPKLSFLWVRLHDLEVCPALQEAPQQAGRSQRAASPHPEEPTAPEGAQPADCTTAPFGSWPYVAPASWKPKEAQGFSYPCLREKGPI